MFQYLKNHPFGVKAFFESSTVLTFALPKEDLEKFIPECLTLDTFQNRSAFLAVAMVQTCDLRPCFLPPSFGRDFFLIGYRVFVKYKNLDGRSLRGLYILKSETNRQSMKFFGNIFTRYNYSTINIVMKAVGSITKITSLDSNFVVEIDEVENADLPDHSPFLDWKVARTFSGPMPFTFSYCNEHKEITIIEGIRENWKPKPITVLSHHIPFLKHHGLDKAVLANAFVTRNIPYVWKKGVKEKWKS